ncbi:indolepyruvate oxidoreductase subunit beta [Clostridium hydrogeniformans]|uniref:indolepyruvate oxidoreductase subunit beta n=1 Tax=Clostridium hydrogeniformans TaxID=349933 RepID=UPI000480DCD8|nr:indolepyruvate oxidoreductase subunit beta [Clostridium hydrogeniformans]
MSDIKSVLLVGVGGQGTILASKILSAGLLKAGYDVKMSEVHGMAQRGGSVTTQVRYGKEVFSPIIGTGQADIIVSFEAMEALRWIENLKVGGKVVVNDYKIPSAPILSGKFDYPVNVIDELKRRANTTVVAASKLAEEIGNIKTMNIILLGTLIKSMNLTEIEWESIVKENVKEKFIDINLKALKLGMELGQ